MKIRTNLIIIQALPLLGLVGVIFVCVFLMDSLFSTMKSTIKDESYGATQLVLNADRDMYQALLAKRDRAARNDDKVQKDYDENIDQAKTRVAKAVSLLDKDKDFWIKITDNDSKDTYLEKNDVFVKEFNQWDQATRDRFNLGGGLSFTETKDEDKHFSTAREAINTLGDLIENGANQALQKSLELKKSSTVMLWVIFIFIFTIVVVANFFTVLGIVSAVNTIKKKLIELSSKEGDLTERMTLSSYEECKSIARDFNNFLNNLHNIVIELKNESESLSSVSEGLASAGTQTAASLNQISANVAGITKRMDYLDKEIEVLNNIGMEVSQDIRNITSKIDEQSQEINGAASAVETMNDGITSTIETIDNRLKTTETLRKTIDQGEKEMSETIKQVKGIANSTSIMLEMVKVIDDIASRISLLGMNAAIEAAHAGESGKGFAVVAEEIRKLAEGTQVNSKRIGESLNGILTSIEASEKATQRTGEHFKTIVEGVMEVDKGMLEIEQSMKATGIGSRAIVTIQSNILQSETDLKEKAMNMSEAVDNMEQAFSRVSGISRETRVGMAEVSIGVTDIQQAVGAISFSSTTNAESVKIIQNFVNRFKIQDSDHE